ncbi:MAG: ABC transporter ATP-binding protein [Candidatus Berkelbacteria bacterium]|nr:ABC transporter ATP-binding protein [Candidatus Berkelbacteria bacterium]
MKNVIEVKNLVKKYGTLNAVNDISFEVKKGEVFGLLGENGAGKTTTLEIIEGLRKGTSGSIVVLGHHVEKSVNAIKEKIGVQLQSSAYFHFLTLSEILNLFCSFYKKSVNPDDLLNMVDLSEKKKQFVGKLSGGQRQRFSIVASLVNDPEIVFLDEPTTGLDPIARRNLWGLVSQIKSKGKTVVLTTHYMEEAELLCDRIAIMDKGKILAMGETHKLIENVKEPFSVNFVASKIDKKIFAKIVKCCARVQNTFGKENQFDLRLKNQKDLNTVVNLVQKFNPELLTVGRATLEDVFIELTGKTIAE